MAYGLAINNKVIDEKVNYGVTHKFVSSKPKLIENGIINSSIPERVTGYNLVSSGNFSTFALNLLGGNKDLKFGLKVQNEVLGTQFNQFRKYNISKKATLNVKDKLVAFRILGKRSAYMPTIKATGSYQYELNLTDASAEVLELWVDKTVNGYGVSSENLLLNNHSLDVKYLVQSEIINKPYNQGGYEVVYGNLTYDKSYYVLLSSFLEVMQTAESTGGVMTTVEMFETGFSIDEEDTSGRGFYTNEKYSIVCIKLI